MCPFFGDISVLRRFRVQACPTPKTFPFIIQYLKLNFLNEIFFKKVILHSNDWVQKSCSKKAITLHCAKPYYRSQI